MLNLDDTFKSNNFPNKTENNTKETPNMTLIKFIKRSDCLKSILTKES